MINAHDITALDRLAGVAAFQFGQLGMVLGDQRGQPAQHTAAFGCRHAAPEAVKGGARGHHRGVDVAPIAARKRGEHPAVGRVDDVDGQTRRGSDRFTVDQIELGGQRFHGVLRRTSRNADRVCRVQRCEAFHGANHASPARVPARGRYSAPT